MPKQRKIYSQTDHEAAEISSSAERFGCIREFYRNSEKNAVLMRNVEEDRRTMECLINHLGKIRNKRVFKSSEEVGLYYNASQLENEIRNFYGRIR